MENNYLIEQVIYNLLPTFTLGLLALSILFKVYRRSVTTFLTISISALSSNLINSGLVLEAILIFTALLIVILYRALAQPDNDLLFHRDDGTKENRREKDATSHSISL